MQQTQNYVGEKNITELSLKIFPAQNSTYSFYEDDGKTLTYKNGNNLITNISVNNGTKLEINIEKKSGDFDPGRKSYQLNIYKDKPVSSVKVNDKSIESFKTTDKLDNKNTGYFYDSEFNQLIIKCKQEPRIKIEID